MGHRSHKSPFNAAREDDAIKWQMMSGEEGVSLVVEPQYYSRNGAIILQVLCQKRDYSCTSYRGFEIGSLFELLLRMTELLTSAHSCSPVYSSQEGWIPKGTSKQAAVPERDLYT